MHLLLLCLLSASYLTTTSAACEACINGICHKKFYIMERKEQIGQLALDRTGNIFYFHIKNMNKDFTCAYDLDNVDLAKIPGVDFSFAKAVDQKSRDVYLSLGASVIKVNPTQNFTDAVTVFNKTVWHMQFKDKLYYKEFLTLGLRTYENGIHKNIDALSQFDIGEFIIDKNDDIYFESDYSLYRLKKGETEAKLFYDEIFSMNTDKSGEAYFVQPFMRTLNKVDYGKDVLKEAGVFPPGTPFNFVFMRENNVIYYDSNLTGMYLLVPEKGSCKLNTRISGSKTDRTFAVNRS